MHITATSVYDRATITALHRVVMFRGGSLRKWVMTWSVPYMLLILAAAGVALLSRNLTVLIAPAVVIGASALIMLYLYFVLPKIQYHFVYKKANISNTFLFEDDCFHATSRGAGCEGTATYEYDALHKAYETDAYLVLYINLKQCIVVEKAGMEEGDVEAIRTRLQIYLDKKYVQVNRNSRAAGYSG